MKKRITSLLLSLVMVLSAFPQGIVLAANNTIPTIITGITSARAGEMVDLDITIVNNPGILGATLTLSYDEGLTLKKAALGDAFSDLIFTQPGLFTSPCSFVWDASELSAGEIKDGVIMTLTFKVSDNVATGKAMNVHLSCKDSDIYDINLRPIHVDTENGGIYIIDYVPGDVDSDGFVNTRDLITMRRYLAGGYNTTIHEPAGNVNRDEHRNIADVITMRRFLAGGYTDPETGEPLKLWPDPQSIPDFQACEHALERIAAKPATCTEAGNKEYWHCTKCGKYFSDDTGKLEIKLDNITISALGHKEEIIPGKAATYYEHGLTEGLKCSRCQTVLVEQQIIPIIQKDSYSIQYMCDMVPSTDTRYYLQNSITDHFHYTVGVEKALPTPQLDKYIFLGWSDSDGNLVGGNGKTLPKNTTGDVVLYANWASTRNLARPTATRGTPTTYEDPENGVILFKYKIGTIENIPLYTTLNLQCADGLITTVSQTNQTSIKNSNAKTVSETIANETTKSATWTLSEEWNQSTKVSQTTIDAMNIDEKEAEKRAKTEGGTYHVGESSSNSASVAVSQGSSFSLTNNRAHEHTEGSESGQNFGLSVDAGMKASGGASLGKLAECKAEYSLDIGVDYSNYGKNTESTTDSWSNTVGINSEESHAVTAEKTWNTETSYDISNSVSHESEYSKAISMSTSIEEGRTIDTGAGGGKSSSEEYGAKDSKSSEFGAVVTYDNEEITTNYTSFSSNGNTHGNYRMVMAGSADVYAIVGYDIPKAEYFVYTYTVTKKATQEYLDYSWDGTFNDYECSILPFEVPYEVNEYVNARITQTEGLMINPATGVVEEYTPQANWHDAVVYVPSYFRCKINGEYKSIKVTGLAEGLFQNNEDIEAVVLSSYISEIPNNAFAGCSSLKAILCPGVKRIGDHAFDGCVSLNSFTVPYEIESLGASAFVGVQNLTGYAATEEIAYRIAGSGARNIVLNISRLSGISDLGFRVTDASSFELDGNGKTFQNLVIDSDAQTTYLDGITIIGDTRIPLSVSGNDLTLDNVNITSQGVALVAKNVTLDIVINNECKLTSAIGKAAVCDNLTVSKLNSNIYGKLSVSGDILTCGNVNENQYLSFVKGQVKEISRDEYENYLKGILFITFDANGGAVRKNDGGTTTQIALEAIDGVPFGELPKAERSNHTFVGWYLGDGTKVTSSTVFTYGMDKTVYAHWSLNQITVTFNANGGSCGEATRKVTIGEPFGTLPKATLGGYTLDGWYTAVSGGNQMSNSSSSNVDITLYAHWSPIYVTSLQVKTPASKTSYYEGDKFSADGLQMLATYNDGTTKTVSASECTISSPNMIGAGTKTVSVTYGGFSAAYSITVNELTISLSCNTSTASSGYITFSANVPCGVVTWASSNSGVASINSSGKATFGNTMSSTTITAVVNNNGCTKSATKTLSLSNTGGTKYKETTALSNSTVMYGTRPSGYSSNLPVKTGSIPSYTTDSSSITGSTTNTSTGKIVTSYANNGVAGYIYYQFNYNSSTGGDNIYKIINYKESYRNCYIGDGTTPSYWFYCSPYGRQFYSTTNYPEHDASANWTKYASNWWAYRDKQDGHTWYVATGISGALAGSWYRFPLYNYSKTTTTYTYYYYSVS